MYNECGEKMDLLTHGKKIIKKINDAGYEAYLVGGAVRDYLLGYPIKDIDITTSATPDKIESIFEKTIPTGKAFGTITVIEDDDVFEITTYRKDGTYLNHRKPESIEFSNQLIDDLKRRDFTINGLCMDVNGDITDAFNGLNDLESKTIKTIKNPHERFQEDALRMIRAFRFQAKLGFDIEKETLEAIQKEAPLIQKVSIERIQDEFKKMLNYETVKPSIQTMVDTGFARACFELEEGFKQLLDVPELKGFERIYRVSLKVDFKKDPWKFPLKTLRKIETFNDILNAFNDIHPRLFLNYPKALIDEVADYHLKVSGMDLKNELDKVYKALKIKDKKDLAINGLMIDEILKPTDKSMIQILLNTLYDKVLEGALNNDKASLIKYLETRKKDL